MTNEFYINGRLIDMPNDSVLALSFAVNTLFDVKTAQGNISNRINLPKTRNNLIALGFLDDLGVDLSQTIRKKNKCRYVVGGVEVIRSGSVEIGDITSNAIGIVFTSGNLDFFDLIDGGSIRDLDLSEYDHSWSFEYIPQSMDNREGYIYPVINYGDLTNSSDHVNVLTMRPATFVRTIINKIIAETGYTVDDRISTDLLAGDQYARMLLPFSNDDFVHGQRAVDLVQVAELQAEGTTNWAKSFLHGNAPVTVDAFDHTIKDDTNAFSANSLYTSVTSFFADISVTIPRADMVKIWFPITGNKDLNYFNFNIVKTHGGIDSVIGTTQVIIPNYGADDTGPIYNYTQNAINITATGIDIIPTDIIKFQILVDNDSGDNTAQVLLYAPIDFNIKPAISKVNFGETVQLEATLPDISKKDYIKGIMNFFCAIFQTDNDNKIVTLIPFRQIPAAVHKAKDWSDKLVNPDGYTRNVTIGDYAQQNSADYKNDDVIDSLHSHYGTGIINIADENLDTVAKQLFEIPFSASYEDKVLAGVNAVTIRKIEVATDIDFSISTGPRICMIQWHDRYLHYKTSDNPSYTYVRNEGNGFTYFAANSADRPGLMFDEILSRYFIEFRSLLNDQRKTIEQLILTANDISELDFFIPVFIRKYAAYFYISKISNYVAGRPCKVDLIKLS